MNQFNANNSQLSSQAEQLVQQLIHQTQQASMQYQQLLKQEQENAALLQQIAQREQQASQIIQTALHGHQTAIQQLQQISGLCHQMESSISHQIPTYMSSQQQATGYSSFNQH
ncbi:AMP-dependent synthetase and ligase [Paenibacillus sp. N4]|uniref:AMP-dependent synthetase and ligase n=1 Tax=Paenibacillus vietnamensis TaxID=2590547 RepID=UPI001CD16065|nr:AMP-dependent synthetase and ligase [Paenibacillus vietnamensis]MCA0755467.1 AMP-dependent synthetase and ligase [Paenibacillus vietnamensis]